MYVHIYIEGLCKFSEKNINFLKMKTLPRVRRNCWFSGIELKNNIPDRQVSVSFKIRKSAKSLHPTLRQVNKEHFKEKIWILGP